MKCPFCDKEIPEQEFDFHFRKCIQKVKKSGGICPGCINNGDDCPNPNWYEGRVTIACAWRKAR